MSRFFLPRVKRNEILQKVLTVETLTTEETIFICDNISSEYAKIKNIKNMDIVQVVIVIDEKCSVILKQTSLSAIED